MRQITIVFESQKSDLLTDRIHAAVDSRVLAVVCRSDEYLYKDI